MSIAIHAGLCLSCSVRCQTEWRLCHIVQVVWGRRSLFKRPKNPILKAAESLLGSKMKRRVHQMINSLYELVTKLLLINSNNSENEDSGWGHYSNVYKSNQFRQKNVLSVRIWCCSSKKGLRKRDMKYPRFGNEFTWSCFRRGPYLRNGKTIYDAKKILVKIQEISLINK